MAKAAGNPPSVGNPGETQRKNPHGPIHASQPAAKNAIGSDSDPASKSNHIPKNGTRKRTSVNAVASTMGRQTAIEANANESVVTYNVPIREKFEQMNAQAVTSNIEHITGANAGPHTTMTVNPTVSRADGPGLILIKL
jgi:hypothetical protein